MENSEIMEADTARRVLILRRCSYPGTVLLLQVALEPQSGGKTQYSGAAPELEAARQVQPSSCYPQQQLMPC